MSIITKARRLRARYMPRVEFKVTGAAMQDIEAVRESSAALACKIAVMTGNMLAAESTLSDAEIEAEHKAWRERIQIAPDSAIVGVDMASGPDKCIIAEVTDEGTRILTPAKPERRKPPQQNSYGKPLLTERVKADIIRRVDAGEDRHAVAADLEITVKQVGAVMRHHLNPPPPRKTKVKLQPRAKDVPQPVTACDIPPPAPATVVEKAAVPVVSACDAPVTPAPKPAKWKGVKPDYSKHNVVVREGGSAWAGF